MDQEGLRTHPEWTRLAEAYRTSVLSEDYDLIRSAIVSNDGFLFWPALILKLAPALLAGVVMGVARPDRALFDTPVAAAFVAFLLFWPILVLWQNVVSAEWQDAFFTMLALYIAYMLAYFFTCRLGAQLGQLLRQATSTQIVVANIKWNDILASVLATFLTSTATAVITWSFASAT